MPTVFSVELVPGALGTGAKVQMSFDYIPFDFRLGVSGKSNDTFTDGTPNYASSTYEFWRGYPAGEYTISTLYVWDDVGHVQNYSAADLAALGLPNHFTVIDKLAPATPTEKVNVGEDGRLPGNVAFLNGTAGAGDSIKITYKDEKGTVHTLGTTTADASGAWKLTSESLLDGVYSQVVAIATNKGGYASTYSNPVSFEVRGAPVAPSINVAKGEDGKLAYSKALIWGGAFSGDTVHLYDNGQLIATVKVDETGWWGVVPGNFSAGAQHKLTATVTDFQGWVSPASNALSFTPATADHGVVFTIGSFSNETSQVLDQAKLTMALDAVSALVSSALGGLQQIALNVKVMEFSNTAIASAVGYVKLPAADDIMPLVTKANLNLSPAFAQYLNDSYSVGSYAVEVLAHEVLHVLGIHNGILSLAQKTVDGKDYFLGTNAMAINGGPVLLSADKAHVDESSDLISPYHSYFVNYFSSDRVSAPYSSLDLAILKDIGYQNQMTLVSVDGHTFIPGDAKHTSITGTKSTALDTVYVDAKSAEYGVVANSSGAYYTLTDQVGDDGVKVLSDIERIRFNDGMVALDVFKGQIGGEVYRMYQAAFDRKPDSAGLGYWIAQMDKGESLLGMASQFKNSAEFSALYGSNLSDSAYVNQLYHNVLHRTADKAGLDYWLGALGAGVTRESVLVDFSESNENVAQLTGTLANGFSYAPWVG
ncbi:DUF4214 domain-containing protein [Pseudoduganella sp. FT55W]|uniref:DUF4214 domain-containing protein n=1 Tax=Duganella rivi TaxID=2666083 RepID=A0A7X4GPP3_9BURK|nr:DUF4214 domain-containing protein [Duganella rivi]